MRTSATGATRGVPILGNTAWIISIRAVDRAVFGAYKKDPG